MTEKQIDEFSKELGLAKEFLPQQVIVKFKDGTSFSKVEETLGVLGATRHYQFKSHALLLKMPDAITKTDILAIVAALNEVESVDYAAPNGILKVSAVPNDPQFRNQADLNNIQAERAWDLTTGSHDVLVGIIDTGVDYRHPDLVQNIWTNVGETGIDIEGNDKRTNGVDDDNNGYVDDVHGYDFFNNDNDPMDDMGHGTHVAGTIGASGNNGIGITGLNWNVGIVPLKFIGADGSGSEADAVKAIEYATMMDIPITNNSWGGLGYNQVLKEAIRAYGEKGGLFVAAAGNNSVDNDVVNCFPANYELDNIISVAAVDNQDNKPAFSNWGSQKVHIAAPGVDILSLAVSGSGETLARMSGTSMAAPHVTGAAALIKSVYPNSDYRDLKSRILFGGDPIPQLLSPTYVFDHFRPDDYPIDKPLVRGGKRLNLENSLEVDLIPPGETGGLRISFSGLTSLEVQFQMSGDDRTSGEASGYLARLTNSPMVNPEDWFSGTPTELNYVTTLTPGILRAEISGLSLLQKGYITVRAVDNVGNLGPRSVSLPFELSKPSVLFQNDGESYEGINSKDLFMWTLPFQQEEVPGRGKVWSDSPNENREEGSNYMEFTQSIEVPHPDVVLQFDTKLDCEAVYERAMVEIRINEETDPFSSYNVWNSDTGSYDWLPSPKWRMLGVYSAPKCDWSQVTIPLRNKLKVGDKVRFRFWFKAGGDPSDGHDGWLIDNIKLLGPQNPERPTEFVATQATEASPYVFKWKDNSEGESRFEIRKLIPGSTASGELVAETPENTSEYDSGMQTVDAQLRVRACNGMVCSEFSEPILVLAPPPRVTSISPLAGPLAGGNILTVFGAGFLPGAIVRLRGLDCPNSVRVSSTQMTCVLPPREAGSYSVEVVNPDSQRGALALAYIYQGAPSISSLTPAIGKSTGGDLLTINGTGFVAGASVRIGSNPCTAVTVLSATQIQCKSPASAERNYNVWVTNSDGQINPTTSAAVFRVVAPKWVATSGGACSSVCRSVGLFSRLSPEGSYCTSGEMIPVSAVGKVPYRNGCWPFRDCRSQGTRSAIQAGQYCYGATQRRDRSKSDITMGCFCGL
ncbi:MAG: hypothetical protein EBQ92_02285 [Proteobacteria bacterium]|nr:hypothetical protein [Pseudomonadota bacterium]